MNIGEVSKKLDAGSTNTCIDQIFTSCEDLIDGKFISGAGGGGFLQVILKKGVSKGNAKSTIVGCLPGLWSGCLGRGVCMVIEIKGNIAHRMSTLNFQLRLDGLRWRIKLMQNTPTASLFIAEQEFGDDTFIFPEN